MANPTLNPDEVNALMSAIQDGRMKPGSGAARDQVTGYDLTSQDRVIRGQMPTLDAINERIASMFGMGLSGRTRRSIRVTSSPASLLKFMDLNSLLAPPATVCVLSLGKGNDQAIVVLEPGVADALLAAALGDRKTRPEEAISGEARRDLTSVERQVLSRLLGMLTDAMTTAWAPVLPLRPEVQRFESDPRMAVIAPPNDTAVLSSFELTGSLTGRMQIAFPYSTVESAKKLLSSPLRMNSGADSRFADALATEIAQVRVELRVALGQTRVTLSRLVELEKGDLLLLDSSEDGPLNISVQGRNKLSGRPTVSGGNLAVVLDRGLVPSPSPSPSHPAVRPLSTFPVVENS